MKKQFAFPLVRIALLAGLAGAAGCTTVLLPPNVTPVVAPSASVEQAARRLEEVVAERKRVEAEYGASEQVCYAKFFVNNCLDAAKEKRRSALAYLRVVEDEAQYYQRKATADARDRDVAKAVKKFEADEAVRAAAPAPPARTVAEPAPAAPKASLAARRAKQDARIARHEAEQAAQAPARAAAAKAFARRKAESEARVRKVEQRKAAKASGDKQ
ncbi:MAG: hypothetical protein H7335_21435 [Massilia sp.]|nr:hypothetical protein [Massilia sp.]